MRFTIKDGASSPTVLTFGTSGTKFANYPVHLPDGSAGAPALAFTNDTDTGMYLIGAGSLGFVVGGTPAALQINASGTRSMEFKAANGRGITLTGPSDTTGPFIWNTGNAYQWNVDSAAAFSITSGGEVHVNNSAFRQVHSAGAVHTGQNRSSGTGLFVGRNFNNVGDVTVLRAVKTGSAGGTEVGDFSSFESHKEAIHPLTDEISPLGIIGKITPVAYDRLPEHAGGNAIVLGLLRERHRLNLGRGIDSRTTEDYPVRSTGPNGVLHEVGFIHENLMEAHPQLITRDGAGPSDRALLALAYAGIQELEERLATLEAQ
jgi:hypothetical protein